MKKNDKFILLAFLLIIFSVFICYPAKTVGEILKIFEHDNEGTWKTYDENATIVEKIKINIENRTTNYFPFYSNITTFYKNINEKINEKVYSIFNDEYIPAGTNSDKEYLLKDTKNNAYYAFSNLSNETLEEKVNTQIKFFNEMYESNPNVNFYIYLPSRLEYQEKINEISPYRDASVYVEKFKNGLNKSIRVEELKLNSIEEYNDYFYKSDHHWNMKGAYVGYKEIMKMMGNTDIQEVTIKEEPIKFRVSFSRTNRNYSLYDYFYTIENYNNDYKVLVNNKEAPSNFKPLQLENLNKKNSSFYDWYVGYFYGLYGNVVYDFNNENKKNLLIISDSYAWQIDFLLASSYNKTHVINIMYDDYLKNPLNYTKYIEENKIDDVLILQEVPTTVFDAFNHNFYEKVVW